MLVGILGGSFDPIHNAHLIVAQQARAQLGLDLVRLMVAARQPLKAGRHSALAEQRVAMADIAAREFPGVVADGRELSRAGPSFTVDTLRELEKEAPGDDLVLLLGADTAARFGEWREPAAIRNLAKIVVFRRGDEEAPAGFDGEIMIPALEISSTAVRARVAAGESLRGWVPDGVADYISRFGLYRLGSGAA